MSDRFISRNTKLLRGAGQTIHEYHAGPNINITEDVISGRDWTQDIQDAVNSGVAGQLSAGDNIALNTENNITTISVTGDLYSAGDNIDITDHTISGKDWTQDIDEHIASAVSGKADTSAIPEIVEYSAGDNINISDHVVSGKDWQPFIDQKADRAELLSAVSGLCTVERMVETVSSTSAEIIDIISATSGQGSSGGCIWISGAKDYDGETLQLSADSVIPILSGWDLSGDHNHSICMKGRYIRMPGSADFFTRNEWNNFYSAGWQPNINALYTSAGNLTYSANYLMTNKLDISAFSAYSAAHSADDDTPYSGASGIKVENHLISITGDVGKTYSAGANIDITDEVVSGRDWTREIVSATSGKADTTAIPEYPDMKPLSGGEGVNIIEQDEAIVISFNGGSAMSSYYVAGPNINIEGNVISGKDWNPAINSATSGKLDTSATQFWDVTDYSAGSNIKITNHVVSGKDWSDEIAAASAAAVEAASGIPYSAGANINVTDHVISGKDWTDEIAAASGIPYSAGDNIDITDHVVSGKDWSGEIEAATSSISSKLDTTIFNNYSAAHSGDDNIPYSGGANIQVENHIISVTGQMGKVYQGIAPIQVDNNNDLIGLDMAANYTFIPGTNIEFIEDSEENTVTINAASYDPASAVSGLVPYSALNIYTDEFNENVLSSIDGLNGETYKISAKYAGYAQTAASAQFDTLGRPLYQLASKNELSSYIPFSAIEGDSATSSISAINGSACAGGDKIEYVYGTPVTSVSAAGDLHIRRNVAAATPDKIKVSVDDTEVGLLAPASTVPAGMLVTNAMGSVSWEPQSALIPEPTSAVATYYSKSLSNDDDQNWVLTAHPTMDHDWVLDVYNDSYGDGSKWFYFSGGGATATLEPGQGVRMHYNVEEDYLVAEPIYTVGEDGYGDEYARRYADLDGVQIRVVGSSAEASGAWNILYIVTGTN